MSIAGGPSIVKSGLVLELDAGNTKSYPGTGTTWFDKSELNTNGTLFNGPTFNTGSGGSIVLDGVDDYINIPVGYPSTPTLTYQLWVRMTAFTNPFTSIISFNTWVPGYVHFNFINGQVTFSLNGNNPTDINFGLFPSLDTWFNLAVVYNATAKTISLYYNGILYNSQSYTTALATVVQPYRIGSWDGGSRFLNGRIANVNIYTSALSAQEVLQNFTALKSRFGL